MAVRGVDRDTPAVDPKNTSIWMYFSRAAKAVLFQPVQVRPEELSVHLGSYPDDGEGDRLVEAPGTTVRIRRAGERAGRNVSEARAGLEKSKRGCRAAEKSAKAAGAGGR